MDKAGFQAVQRAFERVDVEATTTPEPPEKKHVPYVTIESASNTPAEVLNALASAGLMHYVGGDQDIVTDAPVFAVVSGDANSTTLEDLNVPGRVRSLGLTPVE